jgi:hypothetical protein
MNGVTNGVDAAEGWRKGNLIGRFRNLLQKPSEEGSAQTMVLFGIEEKSQEAGVYDLLMDKPNGFEDVETVEQFLYPFQLRSIGLQCL